jgi:GPI mannosyltransferase 2
LYSRTKLSELNLKVMPLESIVASRGDVSKRQLAGIVLVARLVLLLAMALSCRLLPDHNPGDGVLRFDLRLEQQDTKPHLEELRLNCFCLSGHSCDARVSRSVALQRKPENCGYNDACADPPFAYKSSKYSDDTTRRSFYHFMLAPLTKWDAARFLALAADSSMRNPLDRKNESSGLVNKNTKYCDRADMQECLDPFLLSEQSHAFFPLFPLAIRSVSWALLQIVPLLYLPPTYEGTLALSAMLLNLFCFIIATLVLYDLTYSVVSLSRVHTANTVASQPTADQMTAETTNDCHKLAMSASLVFGVLNPASVFFATAYSESLFAMLTLSGHALVARSVLVSQRNGRDYYWPLIGLAVLPWMAASYARSNGTVNAVWLLLFGLAHVTSFVSEMSSWSIGTLLVMLAGFFYHVLLAGLVVFPIRYHDWTGYDRHCNEEQQVRPTWCEEDVNNFSLYGYTQRTHWDVGFLRYYQWKQLPNFLLAAPILSLGFLAVYHWIEWSIQAYCIRHQISLCRNGGSWNWKLIAATFPSWVFEALKQSVNPYATNWDNADNGKLPWKPSLLKNPIALGHYAVLAAVCLVGLMIAHVQISTRLICSSCPALTWFLTDRILRGIKKGGPNKNWGISQLLLFYCGLYVLLGVVLHVNFLPWT